MCPALILLGGSLLLLPPTTTEAEERGTCRFSVESNQSPYHAIELVPHTITFVDEVDAELHVQIAIDADGRSRPRGFMFIEPDDGIDASRVAAGTPAIFQADGANVTCADGDGDGLIGLTSLVVTFANVRNDDTAIATITPEVEVDESGRYLVTIVVHQGNAVLSHGRGHLDFLKSVGDPAI